MQAQTQLRLGRPGAAARAQARTTRLRALASASAPPAVLITGSSTGIGKTTALHLASKGWQVFAGVRRQVDGEALVRLSPSVVPVLLDVTSGESTAAAMAEVARQLDGRNLSGLVNNAGKGVFMPLELMPMEVFDDVMATNVSGLVRVTKAAIPLLRKSREGQQPGRIVNIGSYAGTIAIPLFGAYSASKFSLEALSDVMRYELAPKWGIRTVLIKASGVKTPIWDKGIGASTALMEGAVAPEALLPYKSMCDEIMATARYAEETGISSEEVAATIEEALTAPQPRTRYLIGNGAWLQMTVRRLMPDWLWDSVLLLTMPKTREPLNQ